MKKLLLSLSLGVCIIILQTATAQSRVHLSVNIGSQPIWGPVGFDHVEYYYMPDIDAFYYVPKRQYIYEQDHRWVFAQTLPERYHDYDVFNGYKVVVNSAAPYRHADTYRRKYGSYKGRHDQQVIRDSHEEKYFQIKDHPEHDKWKGEHHGQNGHGHRHG